MIVGSGSISFEMIRYLTERLPIMVAPVGRRPVPTDRCAIGLDYLMEALDVPRAEGVYEIGGPDVLTYNGMMLGYASPRPAPCHHSAPGTAPGVDRRFIDLITPVPYAIASHWSRASDRDVVRDDRALMNSMCVRSASSKRSNWPSTRRRRSSRHHMGIQPGEHRYRHRTAKLRSTRACS